MKPTPKYSTGTAFSPAVLYQEEVNPRSFVEVVVDNTEFNHPHLVRPAPSVCENVSPSSW